MKAKTLWIRLLVASQQFLKRSETRPVHVGEKMAREQSARYEIRRGPG